MNAPLPVRSQREVAAAVQARRKLPARTRRQIERQLDQADAAGVIAAARIHAAAFATQVGLSHVASLSAEADRLCESTRTADPLAAADVRRRLNAIVDAYAQSTLVEIIEMGR